jgi:energy-converting hydrogenase Eha subunit C
VRIPVLAKLLACSLTWRARTRTVRTRTVRTRTVRTPALSALCHPHFRHHRKFHLLSARSRSRMHHHCAVSTNMHYRAHTITVLCPPICTIVLTPSLCCVHQRMHYRAHTITVLCPPICTIVLTPSLCCVHQRMHYRAHTITVLCPPGTRRCSECSTLLGHECSLPTTTAAALARLARDRS